MKTFCGRVDVAQPTTLVTGNINTKYPSGNQNLRSGERISCEGCLVYQGWLAGYCSECEIYACGKANEIPSCSVCPKVKHCSLLAMLEQPALAVDLRCLAEPVPAEIRLSR